MNIKPQSTLLQTGNRKLKMLNIVGSFEADTWVAAASAFVAVCALVVTILQGYQNRKHNKLSVQPFLGTLEHSIQHDDIGEIIYEIINGGVGPAIIKDFILLHENKEVSVNNFAQYINFMKKITENCSDMYCGSYCPGAIMQAGEKHLLLKFKYNVKTTDVAFAQKLNLIVNYESMYRDKVMRYDSRQDRRFHGDMNSADSSAFYSSENAI